MEINQLQNIIEQFKKSPEFLIKGGTPEFWGDTIGRPSESIYKMKDIFIEDTNLVMILEDDEKIVISNPSNFVLNDNKFTIPNSDKVTFQWFYYGKPKTDDNLYYFEYERSEQNIWATSNVTWYNPVFKTDPSKPALEFSFWN